MKLGNVLWVVAGLVVSVGSCTSSSGGGNVTALCASGDHFADAGAGVVVDCQTKLAWQQTSVMDKDPTRADIYCRELVLGQRSWRVPTYSELQTIFTGEGGSGGAYSGMGCHWPAIFAGDCQASGGDAWYLSSNPAALNPTGGYDCLAFGPNASGKRAECSNNAANHVRCVSAAELPDSGSVTPAEDSGSNPGSKCKTPYRCSSDTTDINGLEREYKLEKCDPQTGSWSLQKDCTTVNNSSSHGHGCSCQDSATSSSCTWAGSVCGGVSFTW